MFTKYVYQLSLLIMSTIVPDLPWKFIEINSCLDDWIIALLIVQNYSGFPLLKIPSLRPQAFQDLLHTDEKHFKITVTNRT